MDRFHLDRYLLRTILTPLTATLLVSMLLLMLDQMLRLLDFIVNEAGPADLVWSMLANQLPEYFSLGLPIGLFFGVLFAFRRLSLSSELTAMLATGVSYRRLLVPIYGLAAIMALLTFLTVSYLEPYGQYRYQQIRFAITTGAVGVRVRTGEFIELPAGGMLGAIGGQTDRGLSGVFVETCQDDVCEAIAAERGEFSMDLAGNIQLDLYNGDIVADPEAGVPGALRFQSWQLPFSLPEFRNRGEDEREATTDELFELVSARGAEADPNYDAYRSALHWRFAHSLGLFFLPLLGIAMGVANSRRSSGVGPVLGIVAFVVYNELLEGAERLVEHNAMSPWSTIWPLLAVFGALNVAIFLAVAEQPGGRILEPLERAWRRMKRALRPHARHLLDWRARRLRFRRIIEGRSARRREGSGNP